MSGLKIISMCIENHIRDQCEISLNSLTEIKSSN